MKSCAFAENFGCNPIVILVWAVTFATVAAPIQKDDAEPLFDRRRVLQVNIEMSPADWELLRFEHHDILAALGPDRFEHPEPNPYHTYPAVVVINGEAVGRVGIRKRGFLGSSSFTRPSLGLRFDEYEKEQRFHGLRRMSLNNNLQDPSQVRQVLAYHVFAKAGIPAPRCSLAHVVVNGNDLGVYSHVEAVDEVFLKRRFGSSEGALYEGQISDFRPDWVKTFERKNNKKNDTRQDLEELTRTLAARDSGWLERLSQQVDLDEYYSFWAVESLVGHWDSYSNDGNNFFIYRRPDSGKFVFIPWGADAVFGEPDPFTPVKTPESVKAGCVLPYRLYHEAETRERYRNRLRQLLREVWNDKELLAEVTRLAALAEPYLHVKKEWFNGGLERVRQFIRMRRALLEAELNGPAPEWPLPMKKSACLVKGGVFDAAFSTVWPDGPPAAGGSWARMSFDLDGRDYYFPRARVFAGEGRDLRTEGCTVLTFLGMEWMALKLRLPIFIIQPEQYVAGKELKIDGFGVAAFMIEGRPLELGFKGPCVLVGTMEFREAGRKPGEKISGKIKAEIYKILQ